MTLQHMTKAVLFSLALASVACGGSSKEAEAPDDSMEEAGEEMDEAADEMEDDMEEMDEEVDEEMEEM